MQKFFLANRLKGDFRETFFPGKYTPIRYFNDSIHALSLIVYHNCINVMSVNMHTLTVV